MTSTKPPLSSLWNQLKQVCVQVHQFIRFFWVAGIFGVLVGLVSYLLTVQNYAQVAGTPLGWLINHFLLIPLVAGALAIPTYLSWQCYRDHKSESGDKDDQLARQRILPVLDRHYSDLLRDSAVELPLQFYMPGRDEDSPIGTTLYDLFKGTVPSMLLLGGPGGGKSTQLAKLAQSLLQDAKTNQALPVPILLDLSKWIEKGLPRSLEEWAAEEIEQLCRVPPPMGQKWLKTNGFLLLLDGLDEVKWDYQESCIRAIQAFLDAKREYILDIVIGSRTEEYMRLSHPLRVGSIIEIRPLSPQVIRSFLGERKLQNVLQAVNSDPELLKLLRFPLMLSMIAQMQKITTIAQPSWQFWPFIKRSEQSVALPISQNEIFQEYLNYALQENEKKNPSLQGEESREQLVTKLSWLAKQMQKRGQNDFFLEELQAEWLEDIHLRPIRNLQAHYRLLGVVASSCLLGVLLNLLINNIFGTSDPTYTIIDGAIGGVLGWLFAPRTISPRTLMVEGVMIGIAVAALVACAYLLYLVGRDPLTWAEWLFNALVYGPVFGCCIIFLAWLRAKRWIVNSHDAGQSPSLPWTLLRLNRVPWRFFSNGLLVGLIIGVGTTIGNTITDGTPLEDALDFLLFTLTAAILSYGLARIVEVIKPVETGVFSWSKFWELLTSYKYMFLSMLSGAGVYLLFLITTGLNAGNLQIIQHGQQTSLTYGIQAVVVFWLLFGFYGSLPYTKIPKERRNTPNLGIKLSGRNGLVFGVVLGFLCWLLTVLASLNQGIAAAEAVATSYALVVGVAGGLMFGLVFGGLAYLQHYLLRILLKRAEVVPFHYEDMLDQAASVKLLRRVGSAYQFYHPLLRDYIAAQRQGDD